MLWPLSNWDMSKVYSFLLWDLGRITRMALTRAELRRSFSLLGMVGFSFSIVTCWSALGGTLTVGIQSGGPPVMVFSWIGVSITSLAVAFSFAEMCSSYPLAGGQYSWVAALAPNKWARGLSWFCGWFMLVGIIANGAVNNFIGANFLLGMANLSYPSYTIERWHTTVVAYAIIIMTGAVNIFYPRILNKLSKGILVWNIISFFVIIITLLASTRAKGPGAFQTAAFVFSDFRNDTGLSPSLGVIAGLLQSFYGLCCYDAPAHMTEEMMNATRDAPKAIISAVGLGAVTGFIFLVVAFFCIGDITSAANSSTGVPLIQIFYNSTESVPGACVLSAMITVILLVCANSLMAEASRALWAFARDHGVPASNHISKVDKHFQVPIFAIVVCMIIQAALNTIYIGTPTGFNTVISIAAEGFYISYLMPLLARLLSEALQEPVLLNGPYTIGKWGIACNVVGAIALGFASIIFNFPSQAPITAQNVNYCPAAVILILAGSLLTWILDGKRNFTMPKIRDIIPGVHVSPDRRPESDSHAEKKVGGSE